SKCIYSDTDSMCVNKFNFDAELPSGMKVVGSELGQLEIEHTFFNMICVGKKQYIGSYYQDGEIKYKKRFKGVPIQYITPELYIHLLNDKTAQIKFLKFRREWGSVKGYIESKNVKAT
ncbi:DNA polymerase domain-containing protein, partial [Corynebacterium amycolatum]